MNTKQLSTWKEIVRQCKSHAYRAINVASYPRNDAILAADALVELVTSELAALLEQLATYAEFAADSYCGLGDTCNGCSSSGAVAQCELDEKAARALVTRIREALEETSGQEFPR